MKIAVLTIKGGVGKTALVLLLGLAFATEFKKKVLLVDTDLQADLSYRILGDSLSIYSIFSEEYYGIGRFSSIPNLRAKPINIMDNLDLIPMEHDALTSFLLKGGILSPKSTPISIGLPIESVNLTSAT